MQKNNQNNRCVVYARFSCHNQTEQSIEGQLHDCQKYAENNNLQIVGTYIDRALSATSDKRPQFQQLIKDSAKHNYDIVLVWKLDRFSRNRYDSAIYKSKLKKNGVRVVSVTENISDNPEGILMESILEGYAEYYSAELGQKVRRGMRETAAKGKITCGIPFGYRKSVNSTYEVDPLAAPAIKKIFEMYSVRVKNSDIADWLNSNGYKTKTGKKFTPSSIFRIINQPRYAGRYFYDGVEYTDESQRIVSNELYNKVQLIAKANKKNGAIRKAHERYILSGKLYCGKCKQAMRGESGTGKQGTPYCYYKCASRKKDHSCDKLNIRKEFIEDLIINHIIADALSQTVIDKIITAILNLQNSAPESDDIVFLKLKLADTEKRISNLINAMEQGIVTGTTKQRLEELEALKSNIETEINKAKLCSKKLTKYEMQTFFDGLKALDISEFQDREKLIDIFINRIYLWDDTAIIIYNFSDIPNRKIDFDKIVNDISDISDMSQLGEPSEIRTPDNLIKSQVLCRLS